MLSAPEERWKPHPVRARVLQSALLLVALGLATVSGAAIGRLVPRPTGLVPQIGWWALVLAAATLALVVSNALIRRVLPLALMLQLTLVFPGRAPSRLSVALRAGSPKRLEAWARRIATEADVEVTPAKHAETVLTLVMALQTHDRRTRGHSDRVRALTELAAAELRLDAEQTDRLRWAALLHDVGKLTVPAAILNKKDALDPRERAIVRGHPAAGDRITTPLAEWMGDWRHAIDQHHERYDGEGYPLGLQGDEISYAGRIVAVTDAFETMTAVRSYKRAMNPNDARAELVASSGSHFDPRIVRAFLDISIRRIYWALGPLSWLAQIPLVGFVPRLQIALANGPSLGMSAIPTIAGAGLLVLAPVAAIGPSRSSANAAPAVGAPGTPPPDRAQRLDIHIETDVPALPQVPGLPPVDVDGTLNQVAHTVALPRPDALVKSLQQRVDDLLTSLQDPLEPH